MKAKVYKLLILTAGVLFLMSCLLPGMIPLESEPSSPMPTIETNTDTVIATLNGKDWVSLQSLTSEKYTDADFAKPGTLTFTATVTNDKPVYFSYGWCTKDQQTLVQNFDHIKVKLSINGKELGSSQVHSLSFTMTDGKVCNDFGALLSEWKPGKYDLKAVATFDQKINDGFADYDPGDYVMEFSVTVNE